MSLFKKITLSWILQYIIFYTQFLAIKKIREGIFADGVIDCNTKNYGTKNS
jgi:hypothetical protein